jgi:sugar phosphate permease
VLAAGTAAQASFSALTIGLPVLAPALRDRFELTLGEVGVVLSSVWLGTLLTLLPWGLAADRIGERAVLGVGLGACGVLTAAAGFSSGYATLVLLLTLAGAAGASVNSASGRAVMLWFGPGERGLALGVRQAAIPAGALFAALVLPPLDARGGLLVLGALCVAGAVVGAAVIHDRVAEAVELEEVEWRLRDRRLWLLCASNGFYLVAQTALLGFTVLFLHDARGFSEAEAAGALAVALVLAAALRIAIGRWSDVLRSRIRPLRLVGLAVTATLALVAAVVDASAWVLVPAIVVACALSMAWNGLAFTIAAELGGGRSGASIGIQQTALSLFGVPATIAFAATVSWTSWQTAFALAAVFPIGGWLTLRSFSER